MVALLIVLPVLYVASFGPACWLVGRGYFSGDAAGPAYWPILFVYGSTDGRLSPAISWYARLGLRKTGFISLPFHRPSGGYLHWQFSGRDSEFQIPGVKAAVEIIETP